MWNVLLKRVTKEIYNVIIDWDKTFCQHNCLPIDKIIFFAPILLLLSFYTLVYVRCFSKCRQCIALRMECIYTLHYTTAGFLVYKYSMYNSLELMYKPRLKLNISLLFVALIDWISSITNTRQIFLICYRANPMCKHVVVGYFWIP